MTEVFEVMTRERANRLLSEVKHNVVEHSPDDVRRALFVTGDISDLEVAEDDGGS
jgi:hypothetical protein